MVPWCCWPSSGCVCAGAPRWLRVARSKRPYTQPSTGAPKQPDHNPAGLALASCGATRLPDQNGNASTCRVICPRPASPRALFGLSARVPRPRVQETISTWEHIIEEPAQQTALKMIHRRWAEGAFACRARLVLTGQPQWHRMQCDASTRPNAAWDWPRQNRPSQAPPRSWQRPLL